MQLKYGSYTHAQGECGISIQQANVRNDGNQVIATRETWQISGMLIGTSAANIDSQVAALIAAYADDGKDLILLLPNGSQSTHKLLNRNTLGGTHVVQPPSFPEGRGAEGATYRTFALTVEAELPVSGSQFALISFEESLSMSGGGPAYGHLEPLVGAPIKQLLKQQTTYRVTQQGSAVGYRLYPTPPGPIWPGALVRAPDIQRRGPRRHGSGGNTDYSHFTTTWVYQFEAAGALVGVPHAWR